MKPTDLALLLQDLYPPRRPVFMHSPPGVGKSAICKQAAAAIGIDYLDIRGLLHDPGDIKFPMIDLAEKRVTWVNSLFPRDPDWKGIVVLEELPLCPPLMQGAFLQVTWDRMIGEYRLPDGAWIVATGNRQQDRAGAGRIISPLLNRFLHVDLESSLEDWQAWAVLNGIIPEIRGYLNYRPGNLHNFNPDLNERAFPSPRSWEMLSDVFHLCRPHLQHPVASGYVGPGPGAEYIGFCQIYRDLPDLNAVLANPSGSAIPREPAVLYALCGALAEKARKAEPKTLKAVSIYAARFPVEFGVLAFRDCAAITPTIFTLPEAAAWLKTHRNLLIPGAK